MIEAAGVGGAGMMHRELRFRGLGLLGNNWEGGI